MLGLKVLALSPVTKKLTSTKLSVFYVQRLTSTDTTEFIPGCRPIPSNKKSDKHPAREHCKFIEPRCAEEKMKHVICKKREFPSHFNVEECCPPCRDVLPRFDDLYYKPSDKEKRKYQQTWSECPRLYILPRKICCTEHFDVPKMEKRTFTRDDDQFNNYNVKTCRNNSQSRCAKITWPGCRKGREPSRCFVIKQSSGCLKICTPYPSYSECKKPKPKSLRPVECTCLRPGPCIHMALG
ncbi:uncharacterized protein LOC105211185 [Zeugodacus cucurbitae]|uniref:Altered inheritance of mitochondria protein 34, mitochondrial n=1 Tax=Zeugodacus cucurbitae TaxID=28588 RepID=A0A0A1WSY9_ZEUCU|nr:uncharacterized protein LOC105211185 [Zeugodacus cucurbitae]